MFLRCGLFSGPGWLSNTKHVSDKTEIQEHPVRKSCAEPTNPGSDAFVNVAPAIFNAKMNSLYDIKYLQYFVNK